MKKTITVVSFDFLKEITSKKNGKKYKIYEVVDEEGNNYETFEKKLEKGEAYEFEVKDNGEYTPNIALIRNDKPKSKEERKWDGVMQRKEESIAWAGAKRDGVALTVALINAKMITDKEKIKPTIEHFTNYLYAFVPNSEVKQVKELSKDTNMKVESEDMPF